MKFSRALITCLIFQSIVASIARSQVSGRIPQPPVVSLSYMVLDPETNAWSISDVPAGDGWKISITNPNEKAIFCAATTLNVSVGKEGTSCVNPATTIGLKIPGLTFGTAGDRTIGNDKLSNGLPLGYEELKLERQKLPALEMGKYLYCAASPLNLDCGFYCPNGKVFNDPWTDNISGGTIERFCGRDGKIYDQPNTITCNPGYELDPSTRASCNIKCSGDQVRDAETNTCKAKNCLNRNHGDTWDDSIPGGDITYHKRCASGSEVIDDVTCLNKGDFEKIGLQCIRKSRHHKFLAQDAMLLRDCGGLKGSTWGSLGLCTAGQTMIRTQPLRFPTAGDYHVRVHMAASLLSVNGINGPMAPGTHVAKIDLLAGGNRIGGRDITIEDLRITHSGSRTTQWDGLNDFYLPSDSGLPENLRMVEFTAGAADFVPNLVIQVKFFAGFVGIGQLDLSFMPSLQKPIQPLHGCKDSSSPNYNPFATQDDGSCASNTPFLRRVDEPSVYFQFQPAAYCHVQNEDQLNAYGGAARVTVTQENRTRGTLTGKCGWPTGFYRRSNEPAVYRVYQPFGPFSIGTQICHVTDEAQMLRFGGFGVVQVVTPDSDLQLGQHNTGSCAG